MGQKDKTTFYILVIVGVVELLGMSTFFTGVSNKDLSGHATSAIKTKSISKTTKTSTACTDSDGGKDYSEKGTTKGIIWSDQNSDAKEYTDSCKDITSLKEFRCVADDGTTDGTAFAYFNTATCTDGYCLDGVCVTGCYDDGDVITTRGTSYVDECCEDSDIEGCSAYSDQNRIVDYACQNGGRVISYTPCTHGTTCVDGACV